MLRRLHIKQFALMENTEIELTQGFNLLSGETGAGKSIIIAAIGLILGDRAGSEQVRDGAQSAFIEALFEIAKAPSLSPSSTPSPSPSASSSPSAAASPSAPASPAPSQSPSPSPIPSPSNTATILAEKINELLESAGLTAPEENESQNDPSAHQPLIITREIFPDSRSSIARVNGRIVPLSFIRELGSHLIDLHGQHQHQSLLRPEKHRHLLDTYGGEKIASHQRKLKEKLAAKKNLQKQLNEIGCDIRERERRLDLLKFQIDEIEQADLRPNEEEELLQRQRLLNNAEKITAAVEKAYTHLSEGSSYGTGLSAAPPLRDDVGRIMQEIAEISQFDTKLENIARLMEGAAAHLEEASMELGSYISDTEFDPGELAIVGDRLELIRNLKRKYGENITEILAFRENCLHQYKTIVESEEHAARLESELKELDEKIIATCAALTAERKKTAAVLEKQLEEVFPALALKKAILKILIEEAEINENGADRIEFLFTANPGESLKPLVSIISGGEASRVMIALKAVFAAQDHVATLIFDEADSGIGGNTVISVAEKLSQLSRHHQILVVTHSPQIAAMADNHYLLTKEVKGKRTISTAKCLTENERKEELARMLDGTPDPLNLKHAATLLERAVKTKSKNL